MVKKGYLKAAVFGLLFVGLAASASAQVTISGGFALSTMEFKTDGWDYNYEKPIGYGGNLLIDILLPIGLPISLGFEAGFDTAKTTDDGDPPYTDSMQAIPLLARVAYHFDFARNLDLYLVGKIGYAFGIWSGDGYDQANENNENNRGWSTSAPGGLAYGVDLGVSFYFTPRFGFFAEVGYDSYALKSTATGETNMYYDDDGSEYTGDWYSAPWDIYLPFTRFLTVGFSLKL